MREPTLHFDIQLAPEDERLQPALEDEIDRRWPWREKPHRNCSLVSTLTIEAGDETRIDIEGWPACRDNIRRHLLRQLTAWRAGKESYFALRTRKCTPEPGLFVDTTGHYSRRGCDPQRTRPQHP